MSKVLLWAYDECGQTLVGFHKPSISKQLPPDANDAPKDFQLGQNEKSARNWHRGDHLPSLAALVNNLDDSFKAQAAAGNPIDQQLQDAIVTHATLARMATSIALDIEATYGQAFLIELGEQIRLYATWMDKELEEFERAFAEEVASFPLVKQAFAKDVLAERMPEDFWRHFEAKRSWAHKDLYGHAALITAPDAQQLRTVEHRYGTYAAHVNRDAASRWRQALQPIMDASIHSGLSLRKKPP